MWNCCTCAKMSTLETEAGRIRTRFTSVPSWKILITITWLNECSDIMICVLFLPQIDLESVFALNPDVAPDEEIPQSPEAPPSNVPKTSKLPKVCSPPAVLSKISNQSLSSRTLSEIIHDSWSEVFAQRQLISPSQCFIHLVVESLGLGLICTAVCAHALRSNSCFFKIFSNTVHKHRYFDSAVY